MSLAQQIQITTSNATPNTNQHLFDGDCWKSLQLNWSLELSEGNFFPRGTLVILTYHFLVHLPWKVPCVADMVLKAFQVPDSPVFLISGHCGTHRWCRPHHCSVVFCSCGCAGICAQLKALLAGGRGGGCPPEQAGWSPGSRSSPSMTASWACLTRWWGWGNTRAPTVSYQVRTQPLCSSGADFSFQTDELTKALF